MDWAATRKDAFLCRSLLEKTKGQSSIRGLALRESDLLLNGED